MRRSSTSCNTTVISQMYFLQASLPAASDCHLSCPPARANGLVMHDSDSGVGIDSFAHRKPRYDFWSSDCLFPILESESTPESLTFLL